MATMTIKSTYSLDIETMQALETLAKRWRVSKSEVLRRVIKAAAAEDATRETGPLAALDRLQTSVREGGVDMKRWKKDMQAERRAWPDRWSPDSP